jgi:hypothetical protein
MDALRFLRGGAAPAAVPPPRTTQQRTQTPPAHAALHAPPLRLWPGGGGGGREKPAAAGSAVRGAEARSPPEEQVPVEAGTGERGHGNWVLQMLRVQPRWEEAADAEATGGGGGDQDPEPERQREVAAAGDGVAECVSCGGEEGCAVGDDEYDGEVFNRASFSQLLKKVSLAVVKEYSKMSYLCNIAYMIPTIQVGS